MKSFDLSLSPWGPYSKRFFGLSHVADKRHGHRFDFTVVPAIYRRALGVPDAMRPSGNLPWYASSDLADYSYRQQLEWKDKIYSDIAFVKISENLRLMRCKCVNNQDYEIPFALHMLAALEPNPMEKVELDSNQEQWFDAVRDGEVTFAVPRVTDKLNFDGKKRGEERNPNAIGGSCIGDSFGSNAKDSLKIDISPEFANAKMYMRYQLTGSLTLDINDQELTLNGDGNWNIVEFTNNNSYINIVSRGGNTLKIDGINGCMPPEVVPIKCSRKPIFTEGAIENSLDISYDGIPQHYGVWWSTNSKFIRHYAVDNFNDTLLYNDCVHQPFLEGYDKLGGNDNFLDIAIQPLNADSQTSTTIYALIATGSPNEINELLGSAPKSQEELEAIYNQRISRCYQAPESSWQFSQERMMAVTLTNIVYPIYLQDYIRHHTPGRRWNSLYTWDSGFIGLGFLEFDFKRALENLQVYITECGDPQNAFIHHGSPVPVQIYLFLELWSRCNDDELAKKLYPSLKQYYDFFAGHITESTTRKYSKSSMLSTWDYFYNSGGWDDYPPQWALRLSDTEFRKTVHAVVPTAHAIRAAKILKLAAQELGFAEDAKLYEEDVNNMTQDLQKYSWDSSVGYFSYVKHDADGTPNGFFLAPDGSNFNMGLDGASPLFASAVTEEQAETLFAKLTSPKHIWSNAGLSTVDKSASYYRTDGYWNGSVWMPYCYFYWKAALNLGRGEFAWQIAKTALDLWERETSRAYACYENFNEATGSGGGWHHFSALSTPVLSFHGAYCASNHVSTGNDLLCREQKFSSNGFKGRFVSTGKVGTPTVIIVTLPIGDYVAYSNGEKVTLCERYPGAYEVTLLHSREINLTIFF